MALQIGKAVASNLAAVRAASAQHVVAEKAGQTNAQQAMNLLLQESDTGKNPFDGNKSIGAEYSVGYPGDITFPITTQNKAAFVDNPGLANFSRDVVVFNDAPVVADEEHDGQYDYEAKKALDENPEAALAAIKAGAEKAFEAEGLQVLAWKEGSVHGSFRYGSGECRFLAATLYSPDVHEVLGQDARVDKFER